MYIEEVDSTTKKTCLVEVYVQCKQVVRLAQVDPGLEDQHHSNQHEVQLGCSRAYTSASPIP